MIAGSTQKNKLLIPSSLNRNGGQKYVVGYTTMPKQSLPNSAATGRSSVTGINAMTKRRKVTDVSFLKSGSVRSGVRT